MPLRPASGGARDLEFDPLGGEAHADRSLSGVGAGATAAGSHRSREHGRPGRGRWLLLLLALIILGALVWYWFPDPPRAGFSSESASFGTVLVGDSSAEEVITVTNLGERRLAVRSVGFSNPVAEDYRFLENTCLERKIEGGASCLVRIAFEPLNPGDRSSFLTFESNDSTNPQVALEALAVAPDLGTAPSVVSFGVLPLEANPESQEVTLSNVGTATLQLRRISIDGPSAPDFSRDSRCPSSRLEPGDACSFEVIFQPSISGPRRAELVVDSNALAGTVRIPLEGVGLWEGPPLDASTEVVDFGEQRVGKRGEPRPVTFTNRTGGSVTVDRLAMANSSSFAIVDDRCRGLTVASGESCSVAVTFLPVRDGGDRAVLSLAASGATEDVEVELKGRGVTPKLEVASRALDFGQQRLGFESAPRRLTLRNTGSATLAPRSISITGSQSAEFQPGSNECVGKRLPPGKSCSIAVGFNPAASGERRATLTIEPGLELAPIRVELSGSGVFSALRSDPGRLDFREVYLGRLEVGVLTLTNEGSARLELRGLRFEGENAEVFGLGKLGCSPDSGLAPGASCAVEITFEPVVEGPRTARLILEFNGPDSPARVELSGEGRVPAPAFRISTESLDLGSAPIGERGEIGTVVISNPGAAWLKLTGISLRGANSESFQLVPGSCDGVTALAPGGSCTVGVRLAPVARGALRAEILVRHGVAPGSATVMLRGTVPERPQ